MLRIEFRGEMIDEISKHALREYPHECCGALLGLEMDGTRYVTAATPIDNVTGDDRRRRFSIAPRDYIAAEREADRQGLLLLGFYHSHPDHPAHPSTTDRQFAQPGFSYPIVSVTRDAVADIRSWRITDRSAWYEEEEVGEGMRG